MNNRAIIEKLTNKIAENILSQPKREIQFDEPLITSGLIDSFHLVDLALIVEDEFGVRIEDTELNSDCFNSIAQLAEIIVKRLNNS